MFPRYIFFRPCRPQQSIATVKSTRGVTCLIMFGAEMAIMREQTLDAIRSLEQQRNNLDPGELSPLKPGRRARIRDTALGGLEGLIHSVSTKRVTLLLEILGQERFLTVYADSLELAD
jgi:transcriptional antiterminator RfaH